MIKAIVFDLGRVLIDIELSKGIIDKILSAGCTDIGALATNESFVDYSTGRIFPEEFYSKVVEAFNIELSFGEFAELWCNIFTEMAGMKGIVEKLGTLYPIGLLSDTDVLHWDYIITNFPWIGELFSNPVLSFQIGVMKPDSRAFKAAAESVGVEPSECLFIDDLQKNIDGAKKVGMSGIRFLSAEDLTGELSALGIDI